MTRLRLEPLAYDFRVPDGSALKCLNGFWEIIKSVSPFCDRLFGDGGIAISAISEIPTSCAVFILKLYGNSVNVVNNYSVLFHIGLEQPPDKGHSRREGEYGRLCLSHCF